MKTIKVLITVYLIFSSIEYGCETHFISLGKDCEVAGQLRNRNLRSKPYPFDWIASDNFSGIILAIQNDMKYFLNPELLTYKETYIENILYHFKYNHFFPIIGKPVTEEVFESGTIVHNFFDYLPYVKKIQSEKIKNLLDILKSQKELIVFIRTHCVQNEAKDFVNFIHEKYPNLKFLLIVVHDNPNEIGAWNIPHVVSFYARQKKLKPFQNWFLNSEWNRVFDSIFKMISPMDADDI